MKVRIFFAAIAALMPSMLVRGELRAQDIPGIEICTVEKTMERRTSCLQSNIDFLQKSMTKLTADYQRKLEAANRRSESWKAAAVSLQKKCDDLQGGQRQRT